MSYQMLNQDFAKLALRRQNFTWTPAVGVFKLSRVIRVSG